MCYSLYLVQAPIIAVIRGLLLKSGIDIHSMSPFLSLPLCFIPVLWIAWQFHIRIERRFMTTKATEASPSHVRLAAAV
jgi:peptidoglycan/LPS O-acetylase OafA/YrhL